PDHVRGAVTVGKRLNVVEWKRGARQNEWTAWSEPLSGTSGRKKTLGGSGGVVSAKEAVASLERFLGA
ncbi:MAG: hypothetical protein ABF917_13310, partial [Gluconobacter oxydans]|uniref:hypothetical protein n=1 Tax=Gluconobacter oxydans TaxID=442 RepID=UPI0039E8209B